MGFMKSLSKVISPIGSVLNDLTGVTDTANRSYNDSVNLMNLENANNIALWNMQNEYNTPSAQIARMADAGIDINPMTYAVGNGNMSTTASSISNASPHMPNYSSAGNPISMLFSVLSGIKGLESAELDNKLKAKAVANYENEHVPAWLQAANFISELLGNGSNKTMTEIGKKLRDKITVSPLPDIPGIPSVPRTKSERDEYFRKLNNKNREWWERYGKHSTRFGDGKWKEHLLDVD